MAVVLAVVLCIHREGDVCVLLTHVWENARERERGRERDRERYEQRESD